MKKQSEKQRLIAILKKSVKWWSWYKKISDLSYADLRYADLSGADLSGANLRDADLSGADLDYSCLTFACKTLKTIFDQKHIIQILYHAAKPCQNKPEIVQDEDLKKLLESDLFKTVANKFHRVKECGKL